MVFSDSPVCTVLVTITAVNFLGGVVPAGTGCQEVIWQIPVFPELFGNTCFSRVIWQYPLHPWLELDHLLL